MKNTGHAEVLLIGSLGFMSTVPKTNNHRSKPQEELSAREQAERLADCKRTAKAKKKAREKLFAELESKESIGEDEERRLIQNNSALRHISTFWNIGMYAKDNQFKVGFGVFYKVMKKDNVKTVWKQIRGWLKRNANPEIILAVSIGYRKCGVVIIRYITTGTSNESIWAASRALEGYIYKTKGIKPELSAALVEDISALALEKYAVDIETKEELLGMYGSELLEMLKAGLLIYRGSRTYRNGEALRLLKEKALPVANKAAFPVNGRSYCHINSSSGCCLVDGLSINKRGIVMEAFSSLENLERQEGFDEPSDMEDVDSPF